MFFRIGVLKKFAIFRGKRMFWGLILIKFQACNFPANIAKIFKKCFFYKTPPVAASHTFPSFPAAVA